METFLHSLSAVLVVLLLTLTGYLVARAGWLQEAHKPLLIKLIINLGVPSICVYNLQTNLNRELIAKAGVLLLVPLLVISGTMLLAALVAKWTHMKRSRVGVFVNMCGLANSIFIGQPMCVELFGDGCVLYVMLYYMVNTAVFQSLGIGLLQYSGEAAGGGFRFQPKSLLRLFQKPPFLALLVSLLLAALNIRLPEVVLSYCKYMGNLVSPLGLIYTGFIIYEIGLTNIRLDRDLTLTLLFRFLFSPCLCMLLCALFGAEGLLRSVFIVLMAMPTMTQIVVLAASEGADERFAALGAAATTIASFVVIPVLMLFV